MCPSLVHPTPNTKSNHARTKRWMNNNYMNQIIHNQIFAYIFLSPYFPMIELSTIWTHSRVILDWILFRSVLGRTVRARYVCRLCMCHAVSTTAVAMWGDACSTALEHRLRNDFFINVLYQCDIFHWIFEWLELCEAISCFFFFLIYHRQISFADDDDYMFIRMYVVSERNGRALPRFDSSITRQ